MFDVLIIGGGAAGMQCALVLGSAKPAPYAADKTTGIIMHQKGSHLQTALFNNVLGLEPGTTGVEILERGKIQLKEQYPHIQQIENEKVLEISGKAGNFSIRTNRSHYQAGILVIATGYTDLFNIEGLKQYLEPHAMSPSEKNRVQLRNKNGLVTEGIYVAGTLAGGRSQFAIAAGSGAQIATDILTLWNNGKHSHVHDKTEI